MFSPTKRGPWLRYSSSTPDDMRKLLASADKASNGISFPFSHLVVERKRPTISLSKDSKHSKSTALKMSYRRLANSAVESIPRDVIFPSSIGVDYSRNSQHSTAQTATSRPFRLGIQWKFSYSNLIVEKKIYRHFFVAFRQPGRTLPHISLM